MVIILILIGAIMGLIKPCTGKSFHRRCCCSNTSECPFGLSQSCRPPVMSVRCSQVFWWVDRRHLMDGGRFPNFCEGSPSVPTLRDGVFPVDSVLNYALRRACMNYRASPLTPAIVRNPETGLCVVLSSFWHAGQPWSLLAVFVEGLRTLDRLLLTSVF